MFKKRVRIEVSAEYIPPMGDYYRPAKNTEVFVVDDLDSSDTLTYFGLMFKPGRYEYRYTRRGRKAYWSPA